MSSFQTSSDEEKLVEYNRTVSNICATLELRCPAVNYMDVAPIEVYCGLFRCAHEDMDHSTISRLGWRK